MYHKDIGNSGEVWPEKHKVGPGEKYYVLDINELYVGFECYANYDNHRDSVIIDEWLLRAILHNELKEKGVIAFTLEALVGKYLDKEDIVELGFPIKSHDDELSVTKFRGNKTNIVLTSEYINISIDDAILGYPKRSTMFHGNIKNKSELIKVLKQLDIVD